MVIVGVPALKLRILSVLQDVLLSFKVRVVVTDPGTALHTDRVHPVHEASVLEVVTVSSDLQLPPSEALPLIEGDLSRVLRHVSLSIRPVHVLSLGKSWPWIFIRTPGARHRFLHKRVALEASAASALSLFFPTTAEPALFNGTHT